MNTIIIKLTEPVQFGTETIATLEMRKPKAGDMRDMPLNMGMGDMLNLVGKCTGQPPSVIDELSFVDMTTVVEKIGAFITPGLPTGGKR